MIRISGGRKVTNTTTRLKTFITLGFFMTVIGLISLLFSMNWGLSLADSWLAKRGGADTSLYLLVIEGYTNMFLAAGSILFGIGLVAILFASYKIITIKD